MSVQLNKESQELPDPDEAVTGQAVSVNILKGGIGKSSLSLNLTDRLAHRGHDVLLMDLDLNGHLTGGLGFDDVFEDPTHDLANNVVHGGYADPEEFIYETDFGWDFVPASVKHESLEQSLSNEGDVSLLRDNFVDPLLESSEYDYIITDGGGEWSMLAKNAYGATRQTMIPITPGKENFVGFERTYKRAVQKIKEVIDFRILAIVPNKIRNRIDHNTAERKLLENLNRSEVFSDKIPSFARIPPEDWDRIDAGEVNDLPKPGLRWNSTFAKAYEEGQPVGRYDPDADVLDNIDEMAAIVEQQGVINT